MGSQDSVSVHVLTAAAWREQDCVLPPNQRAPWLLPSCPGMVSAQLLEERPSNSSPVPAQLNVHLPASMSSPLPGV